MRLMPLWVVCLAALATAPVFASFTGLLIIPTAETVGADQYSLQVDANGQVRRSAFNGWLLNSQFGFGDRLEAGADYDLSSDAGQGARFLLNWKYLTLVDNRHRLYAAIGHFNAHPQHSPTPYLVISWDPGAVRLHSGLQRGDGHVEWLVGIDRSFDRLTLMADYTQGAGNSASAGFGYRLSDAVDLSAGLLFPNDGSGMGFTIQLSVRGNYR